MNRQMFIIIIAISVVLFTSSVSAATAPVLASDINCDERPNHEYCTGEEGRLGMTFCTPEYSDGDCYSRD